MTKTTGSDLDERVNLVTDAVMNWFEAYWYEPLERLANRMPFWLYLLALPVMMFAMAVPPLLVGAVVFIPYVLVIMGVLALVGVL